MDLDGDGDQDLLSGSYSRHDKDMAGLFQVLWREADGTFRPAEVLPGTDGKPLILAAADGDDGDVQRICTRPTAVDLDADGKLDIVSGNFAGTFAVFAGRGKGQFEPVSKPLGNGKVKVDAHSDPFFADWDRDGDLDLFSGSAGGSVFLFVNEGSAKKPRFGSPRTLFAPRPGRGDDGSRFGEQHITGPQGDTRVWVDDLNGDGKLDLLVGDAVRLTFPVEGVSEAEAKARLAKWNARQAELARKGNGIDEKAWEKLEEERAQIVRDEATGFVWVLYQR